MYIIDLQTKQIEKISQNDFRKQYMEKVAQPDGTLVDQYQYKNKELIMVHHDNSYVVLKKIDNLGAANVEIVKQLMIEQEEIGKIMCFIDGKSCLNYLLHQIEETSGDIQKTWLDISKNFVQFVN